VRAEGLAGAVRDLREETREHALQLEQVFRAVGAEPSSNLSPPAETLADHHEQLAGAISDDRLADVFHAATAIATEHHALAAYESLLGLADAVGLDGGACGLLERNRDEEARALERLRGELPRLVRALAERS